jgi:hypothetical protein
MKYLKETQPEIWVYNNNEKAQSIAISEATNMSYTEAVEGVYYSELVEILGPPTFPKTNKNKSIHKEWVLYYRGEIFTIYDYNVQDEKTVVLNNHCWNVGSKSWIEKSLAFELVEYIKYIQSMHRECKYLNIELQEE